ncbi:MAG: hypothetical protein JGK17_13350 [Microcoleus sp. PH2017_10_PVI_O_A]|nr:MULTISPECIES: hypothetical protein [unclassified Microcoleus]MCC3406548.1 hypothetical protein [Microcoleus sp. PH2017_10_PVI_O_A]MCC3463382.1 hypothetical protein [Microcoleus sp. PH2017_11_PCY_U_A]MCC3481763.1 hypothetical protein [Microcoleus sp. PH2017_12_PCY_D_A]MCC3529312.1 hypothetical protein [Microcoleus sp. PH2017_21_RUC_O_A]MCC3541545.1 hypothetical protein [Microcoleus sp. PH2017_22_RUC_O_B]
MWTLVRSILRTKVHTTNRFCSIDRDNLQLLRSLSPRAMTDKIVEI